VSAGTEYRIAVDGYEGEAGAFTLRWSRVQPPAYDDFAASRLLEGARGRLEGTNFGATREPQEPTHAGGVGATVWFAWTAPISGLATVETCGSTFDTVLAVYTGDALAQLALVRANDDACGVASRVQFPVQAGARFRVVLDGLTRMGDFVLSWTFPPANDARAAARAVTGVRGSLAGTNVGASKETGEPDHARFRGGASVWYRWRAPKTFRVAFATCGAPFDTVLAVYRRTGTRLAAVASNDDGCRSGAGSLAAFSAQAGATYLIALDGVGASAGMFALTWGVPPAWAGRCVVPTVRGTTLAQARRLIAAANCSVGRVSRVRSSIVPRGRVVTQFPEPGTRLRNGSKVHMEVSSGRRG
jgi:hypothetical protein